MNKSKVEVLLASYNGEKYIQAQVESIVNQIGVDVSLIVRDDGSNDNTCDILQKYVGENFQLIRGNNLGSAKCFYELIKKSNESEFYAFSDQDDLWDADKLLTGIKMLESENADIPLLYYCNNRQVDKENRSIVSDASYRIPSTEYRQALVISNAQGATMVFNTSLMKILKKCIPDEKNTPILHDGWTHKVCLAVGGKVIYDPIAHISYRIHESNVLARNPEERNIKSILQQLKVEHPHFCQAVAKEILNKCNNYMNDETIRLTRIVADYTDSPGNWIKLLFSKEIRTGNIYTDLFFKYKVLVRKA